MGTDGWFHPSGMRFAVLGPLSISQNGGPVSLGGRKQRTLLAVLLLHANDVVHRDQLIDALWGEEPPPSAAESLDTYVYRLRKALGHDRLPRNAGGYLLRVEPGELDVDRFERLVASAGSAAEAGDHAAAVGALTRPSGCGAGRRGPTCATTRRPPAKLSGSDRSVCSRWRNGFSPSSHSAVTPRLCPELESLVAEHPLRERLRGQLMLALYRSGRQADALEVYRAGRSRLVEELALEPGPQLKQLERAILAQDTSLDLPRAGLRRGSVVPVETPAEELISTHMRDTEPTLDLPSRHRGRWAALAVTVAV